MENNIKHSKYRIIKKIGQGAFGSAYEVLNINDNKKYVIKEIQIIEAIQMKLMIY